MGLFYFKKSQSFYWDKHRFRTNLVVPFFVDPLSNGDIFISGSSGVAHRTVLENVNKCKTNELSSRIWDK